MSEPVKQFGIIGLGRMGGNLALQALEKGFGVAGVNKAGIWPELLNAGLRVVDSPAGLLEALEPPRAVFVYVPAGGPVEDLVQTLGSMLEPGDIVADGGNSYWGDSVRRAGLLRNRGIHFVDLGTSGGVDGARNGACFMAGGDEAAVRSIEPVLQRLSVPGGYVYCGPPGSGHFTKLVHNGIEFGMLQAIGEGMDLMESFPGAKLAVADILKAWQHGSVIRSWLIELMEKAYREEGGLSRVPGYVEDTGEVNWLVGDSMQLEVPLPVISAAVNQLFVSRDDKKYWARAVAMMRRGFGGHPYGPDPNLKRFRRASRVGGYTTDLGERGGVESLSGPNGGKARKSA